MQAPYVARVHQFDSTRCALLTLRACLIITHQYNRWNVGIQTLPKLCSPTRSPQKNPKKKILGYFFCIWLSSVARSECRFQFVLVMSLELYQSSEAQRTWGLVGGGRVLGFEIKEEDECCRWQQQVWLLRLPEQMRIFLDFQFVTVCRCSADSFPRKADQPCDGWGEWHWFCLQYQPLEETPLGAGVHLDVLWTIKATQTLCWIEGMVFKVAFCQWE